MERDNPYERLEHVQQVHHARTRLGMAETAIKNLMMERLYWQDELNRLTKDDTEEIKFGITPPLEINLDKTVINQIPDTLPEGRVI